jgi:hypothetical protein
MFRVFLTLFTSPPLVKAWHIVVFVAPIAVPLIAFFLFLDLWIRYKQREWILSQSSTLLEIKLPAEIFKSPAAIEVFLNGIYEPIAGSLTDIYLKGKTRPWFSLEIISIGGQVKYYIWTFPNWKRIIEARLYAQFPNIEIHEVADYATALHYDAETMSLSAIQTEKVKHTSYPIKTYVDFGLDKKGDEDEEKIDPLAPLLEYLGTLKGSEQCWYQILIRAHKKEGLAETRFTPKPSFDKAIKSEIQKYINENPVTELDPGKKPRMMDLTKVQQETIESIQRAQGKLPFDVMIRAIYTAKKEDAHPLAMAGMVHAYRPFGSPNLNGIKPVFSGIDYPWQDFLGMRKANYQRMILDAYRRRSAFNGPYKNWNAKPYVMNTEELATLWHFPSHLTVSTPTLQRIPSKKAEAPANLPV